jgi:hypothetical protein
MKPQNKQGDRQRTPRSPFGLPPKRRPPPQRPLPSPSKLVTMAATITVGSPDRNLLLTLRSLSCPMRQSLMQLPQRSLSRASRVILRSR